MKLTVYNLTYSFSNRVSALLGISSWTVFHLFLHQLYPFASWAVLSMPTTDSREAGGEMVTGEATWFRHESNTEWARSVIPTALSRCCHPRSLWTSYTGHVYSPSSMAPPFPILMLFSGFNSCVAHYVGRSAIYPCFFLSISLQTAGILIPSSSPSIQLILTRILQK
jgi:hypothetical protein